MLRRVQDGTVEIALSVEVLYEYEEVLLRPANLQRVGRSEHTIRNYLKYLAGVAVPAPRHWTYRPILADPDDEKILEAALGGTASDIVTFNSQDFVLPPWFGIGVFRPADFLRQLA